MTPFNWGLATGMEMSWLVGEPVQTEIERGVRDTVRRFILRSVNVAELRDDDDLFELGIANSLFAIQLMTFIEKTFALQVETDDLDIDNFRSLGAATAFVMKKSGPQCLGFQPSGVSTAEKSVGTVD